MMRPQGFQVVWCRFAVAELSDRLRRKWERFAPPALSLGLHLLALGLLSVFFVSLTATSQDIGIDTRWSEPEVGWQKQLSSESVFDGVEISTATGPRSDRPQEIVAGGTPLTVSSLAAAETTSVRDSFEDQPRGDHLLAHVGQPRSRSGGSNSVTAANGTAGRGSGDAAGAGQGFFDVQSGGNRFVFVVDCSASMNSPYRSQQDPAVKTRFQKVQLELVRAIQGLSSKQQFFVIFFNRRAIPMPASELLPATPENQRACQEWVSQAFADGDTDPGDALRLALTANPDVIYLLTDGQFQRRVGTLITRLNQERVKIHTLGFGRYAAADLLRDIAESNRGTYRFLP
ncbi:MAG: VWA domain-containing protein [Planctomycetales bacterium]|nr:VWA domain-containing protein [Planctomycetales bacterium]